MCGASFCILRAIFVATPTGEVSEVEIFLRFNGVSELALSSVFARTCSQQSVFFRVHPLSVRGLTFTCMRGSVINMLDFAVYAWTTCVACPLAAFGGSISPFHHTDTSLITWENCARKRIFSVQYKPFFSVVGVYFVVCVYNNTILEALDKCCRVMILVPYSSMSCNPIVKFCVSLR